MRRSPALLRPTLAVVLAAAFPLLLAACGGPSDAERAAKLTYDGRTLEEWWQVRRGADAGLEREAGLAMRVLGAGAVPFLAEKATSHDLGDMIGGSTGLEGMCPNALPAMEAARKRHPSAALEAAIRRVRGEAPTYVRFGLCTAAGEPVQPNASGGVGAPAVSAP